MKKICWIFLLAAIPYYNGSALAQKRGQELIDSLLPYLPRANADTHKVKLLFQISYQYPYINPDEGLKYGEASLKLAEQLRWLPGIAGACSSIGANYANKADYAKALEFEYRALKIYEQLNDRYRQAGMLRNLGIAMNGSRNHKKALEYDLKALSIFQDLGEKADVAILYGNIANVYRRMGDKDKVIEYHFKSLQGFQALNDLGGTARVLGNIANYFAEEGDYHRAMVYYFDALRREKALGNKNGVTRNMGNIGETYLDIARDPGGNIRSDSLIPAGQSANLRRAVNYLRQAVDNALAQQQTEYFMAYAEVLSDAYMLAGDSRKALDIYKDFIATRDSVYDVEKLNEAARKELEYEYGKREDSIAFQKKLSDIRFTEEKKQRNREQWYFGWGLALVGLFSGLMYHRWRISQQQKRLIEQEKRRSDELLLNILPGEVAEELKATGRAAARQYDQVTVLFTDFRNFTDVSERLGAQQLVDEIHRCYSAFDEIIARHGVEKIKTIGDAYMCAGGLPVPNATHAFDVVKAALEIRDFMAARPPLPYGERLEIRLGIHTGPVVAGIVGIRKFAYDIWGNTVNIAARMESSGETGKINISEVTYALVREHFKCRHRGKVEAKNKGEIDMYFVD